MAITLITLAVIGIASSVYGAINHKPITYLVGICLIFTTVPIAIFN